jgi:hypothetical protein
MNDPAAVAGKLPPWSVKDLPAPPAFTFKNVVAVIGPGTIALSMSIGGGEWLVGPATIVKYGFSLMWICALGIVFQLLLNYEFIRYTLYTGEPAVNGFMRTRPGPAFWGAAYIFMGLCQVGWPAWAKSSSSILFALFSGGLPDPNVASHATAMGWIGVGTFVLCVSLIAIGGRIERTLEKVNWFMVLFVVAFLVTVNLLFVPARAWGEAVIGHIGMKGDGSFMFVPKGADWILLGAFAGFAGNGGIGNIWTSNWIRDKGMGMGSVVGYIPSAVGGTVVKVSPIGSVFPVNEENLSRWRAWWKYVKVDQKWVWAVGCFLGMYLNVLLAASLVPPGEDMGGIKAGAIQAKYISEAATAKFGSPAAGQVFWYLSLLNGFWILFGTQLCIIEGFVRLTTDIAWSSSSRIREATGGDIRRVYYSLLGLFALWGCIAINLKGQFQLMTIAANVAGFILVVGGIHVLVLNRKLPRELRGSILERGAIVGAVLFYTFFSTMNAIGVGVNQKWWGRPF